MIDPYSMVLINIISSAILAGGIIFYIYIWPKQKPNLFLLLLLLSLLPTISIFRDGVYESGDFVMHIYRGIEFFRNLQSGNIMPSWGGELNMTIGYPVFIFNYILTYYILSLLHIIGFSFVISMKILLFSSYVLSGIFMYLWSKKIFKNKLQAFTAAVFYLFGPYHLVVQHYRVNGEVLGFTFLPLLLLLFYHLLQKPTLLTTLTIGFLYGLFFLAHSPSAVFSIPILLSYVLLTIYLEKKNRKKKILLSLCSIGIGIILAGYVFVAHLVLGQYTYTSIVENKDVFIFTDIQMLLVSPWRLGLLFQGPQGELGLIIGYTQLVVVIGCIYLFLRRKIKTNQKYFIGFWLLLTLFLTYMITPWSAIVWETIPILSIAQFSYRLLLFVVLSTSVLAGYLIGYITQPRLTYALIIITIAYTTLNWGNRGTIPFIDDRYLIKNVPHSTLGYEGMAIMASPKWLDEKNLWELRVPKSHIEIIQGNAEVKEIFRNPTKHTYIINAESYTTVQENTLYFPGWKVFVDNEERNITYTDAKHLGKILFNVQPGLHYIEVIYDDLPIYKTAKKISLIGNIIVVLLIIVLFFKRKK